MSNRITVDLQTPELLKLLRWEATERSTTIREIVVEALENYFSSRLENQALLNYADSIFTEWENEEDSIYDQL